MYWPSMSHYPCQAVMVGSSGDLIGKTGKQCPRERLLPGGNRTAGLTALGLPGLRGPTFYAHSLYLPAHLRSKQAN